MGNKLVPKIRFSGYTDDWEQRKLGDVADIMAGGDVDKSQLMKNGRYPVFANALTNDGVVGYYNEQYRIEAPAITVTGRGDIGHAKARNVNFTPVVRLLAVKSKHDIYFLENAINNHYALPESTGVPQLTAPQLGDYKIIFPKIEEQQKIGSFFSTLDYLITLHQRKLDMLKKMKRAYLQQMFPEDGESIPRLRFAGFEGKWDQRKLGEVVDVNSGTDYKHLNKGDIPVYGTGGYMLSVDGKLSDVNAIGIGRKGTIDRPQILKAPFWTVDTLFYMIPYKNYDLYFLYSMANKIPWKQYDESTGVPSLSKTIINNISLFFPSCVEQKKIGIFFKSFDDIIALHQTELDKLNLLKKSYLQKMFT